MTQPPASSRFATATGMTALFIWSFSALIVTYLAAVPILEILFIIFTCSFIVTAIKVSNDRKWKAVLSQPLLYWMIGAVCIFGNYYAYYQAFRHAPPAEVDLIHYLWPIFVVLTSGFLPTEKFSPWYILGALVSFIGIAVLLVGSNNQAGLFDLQYWEGYTWAIAAALAWTVFAIGSRYYKKAPPEMAGIFCGIGALLSFCLHIKYEHFVVPALWEAMLMLSVGVVSTGFTFYCWSFGIKKGNFNLLSVLSYAIPLLSIIILMIFGKAAYKDSTIIAAVMVSIGCWISSKPKFVMRAIARLFPQKTVVLQSN